MWKMRLLQGWSNWSQKSLSYSYKCWESLERCYWGLGWVPAILILQNKKPHQYKEHCQGVIEKIKVLTYFFIWKWLFGKCIKKQWYRFSADSTQQWTRILRNDNCLLKRDHESVKQAVWKIILYRRRFFPVSANIGEAAHHASWKHSEFCERSLLMSPA